MSISSPGVTVNGELNISGATVLNTGTLTFPTTSCNILGDTTSNTVTNKNITGTSNLVDANNLRNGSTWSYSLGGNPPEVNQTLQFNGSQIVFASTGGTFSISSIGTSGSVPAALQAISLPVGSTYVINSTIIGNINPMPATGVGNVGVTIIATISSGSSGLHVAPTTSILTQNDNSGNAPNATIITINSPPTAIIQITGVASTNYLWTSYTTLYSTF